MIYVDPYGLWGEDVFDYGRSALASPRFHGACQMAGGLCEMKAGLLVSAGSYGLAAPLGFAIGVHGADQFITGFRKIIFGEHIDTPSSQILQTTGMSPQTANLVNDTASMLATMGGTAALRNTQAAIPPLKYPQSTANPYVKLMVDKQNKHIVGKHNFKENASIFSHPDPEELLYRFAGTGRAVNKVTPGKAGYREIVDFQEIIGIWKEQAPSTLSLPTTKGSLHYCSEGVHIVPARP